MNIQGTGRIGRLAPSPTGALHVGNIRTFMIAWLHMRSIGGNILLRIEDLDHPKHKKGADEALMDELRWLGFDWDGEVTWQSQRTHLYHKAMDQLRPSLYPCTCTRADIQNAQSAPHPGEVLRYPNRCRNRNDVVWDATHPPAWRLALTSMDDGRFTDGFAGVQRLTAAELQGDFVVARGEEASYTLAVVVDDAAMGISDVVRGDDILPATPAQIVLYQRLGYRVPTFYHLPLVVGQDGRRLAKRHGDTRIATYRNAGMTAGQLLTALAHSCGWTPSSPVTTLRDLIPYFSFETIPATPLVWSESLLS